MKIKGLVILLFITFSAWSQKDNKAENILNKLAEQNKANKTIKADFTVQYKNLQSDNTTTSKGKIIMKGDQYKLDVRNSVVFYNGKTMWNYLKEANEVNISEPVEDPAEQDILNHPNQIFEIYKKDFKYKFMGQTSSDKTSLYEIDLYPKDLEEDYSRIKLKVNQVNYHIHSAKIFGKDGSRITFLVDNMKTNTPVPDSTFIFNKEDYPGVEVIDMRF